MTDQMRDIDHTNPYTGQSFGERVQVFDRGQTVAADGGRDEESSEETERNTEAETMDDVDHEPPNETDGANRVYERGTERRDDSV